MIYKFKSKNQKANLELEKVDAQVKMSLFDDEDIFVMEITKETLYDFIGALHSLQSKIKKEGGANV